MKGKILKIKNAMVTFISIEYSEPKILTWNLVHHHSPSYLAILFGLKEKLARHFTSPRLSSEFCRTIQFSNCLVVCHYHDFLPKQLRSSEPFLILNTCFPYVIASSCQKPIRYVGCIFILLNDGVIGILLLPCNWQNKKHNCFGI